MNGKQLQKGTGSGYGLQFISSYLKLIKGGIKIESEEYVGSKVTIHIPIEYNEETIIDVSIHDENNFEKFDFKKYKFLLVDDCGISRKLIPKLFHNIGKMFDIYFEITTSDNGESGLRLLKTENYDIILSDYWMPIMDGETMLSKYIEYNPINNSIIKLDSANITHEVKDFEVLKKPMTQEKIEKIIKELIEYKEKRLYKSNE